MGVIEVINDDDERIRDYHVPTDRLEKQMHFSYSEICYLVFLFFLSYWTRNLRLQFPPQVTPLETDMAMEVIYLARSNEFTSPDPPLPRLLFYAHTMLGIRSTNFNLSRNKIDFITLRQLPGLLGTFCPSFTFVSARMLGYSTMSSLTASIMILCEPLLIVDSRSVSTHTFEIFFASLAIMFLSCLRCVELHSRSFYLTLFAASVSAGCAMASNRRSILLLPIMTIALLFHRLRKKTRSMLLLWLPAFMTYSLFSVVTFMISTTFSELGSLTTPSNTTFPANRTNIIHSKYEILVESNSSYVLAHRNLIVRTSGLLSVIGWSGLVVRFSKLRGRMRESVFQMAPFTIGAILYSFGNKRIMEKGVSCLFEVWSFITMMEEGLVYSQRLKGIFLAWVVILCVIAFLVSSPYVYAYQVQDIFLI